MKRVLDVVCSSLGLVLLFLPLLVVAVLTRFHDGGPVFFRGTRIGRYGKPFRILKFRTMVVNADRLGGHVTTNGDPRVTRIGGFLRRYKLDELPQLINVLLGQMSLVGPRPEVPEYVDLFTEEEKVILSVRPGVTDWASIWNPEQEAHIVDAIDAERIYLEKIRPEKIRLQLKYVREQSLWVDLKVLFTTLKTLLLLMMRRKRLGLADR